MKKIISLILTVLMLSSSILCVDVSAFTAEGTITNRAEWLSQLAKTFEMTVESDNYPDNYFSDLAEDSKYYYDVLLAVEFGVVDVEAGGSVNPEGDITREFAAQTLNFCLQYELEGADDANFQYTFTDFAKCEYPVDDQVAVNRGWFKLDANNNFSPEKTVTAEEIDIMLTDAEETVKGDEIDENYNSTYEFSKDVVEIPSSSAVEFIDETHIIIYDTSVSLKNGDTFVVYSNEIPLVYQASEVTAAEDCITVTVSETAEKDAVTAVDIQSVVDVDANDFIPAEGVEVVESPAPARSRAMAAKHEISLKTKIPLPAGNSINLNVKISDIKISTKLDSENKQMTAKLDCKLSLGVSAEFNSSEIIDDINPGDLNLGEFPVAGIGYIKIEPKIELCGKTELKQTYNITAGFTKDESGVHNISFFHKEAFTYTFEGSGNLGVKISAGIKVLTAKAGVYFEIGVKAKASAESSKDANNVSTYCLTLSAYLYSNVGFELKINILFFKFSGKSEWKIFYEKNSPVKLYFHFENGKQVDACTVGSKTETKYVTPSSSQYGSVYEDNISNSSNIVSSGDFKIFTYSDGTAGIEAYYGSAKNVSVPEYIDGCKITCIGARAFKDCTSLTSVTIPDSVTSIGDDAFDGCTSLTSVTIPNSVTSIGDSAFSDCRSLTSVTIPNSVTNISDYAFDCCTSLTSATIPDSVTSIGWFAFRNCTSLTSVTIPNSVKSIDYGAFLNCTSLTSVTIPNSVTSIGDDAFYNCTSLKSVTIPDSVTSIGDDAFSDCTSLTSVTIGNGVTSISKSAFSDCTSLKSVTIPDSVTSIGDYAFSDCTSLTSVTIPDSVTSIGWFAFRNCTSLASVTIPNSVTSIGDYAFEDCTSLTSVTIPDSVTEISWGAFNGCTSLTNVTIPSSVTSIGDFAFQSCTSLTSVTIPDSITSISDYAFRNCTSLASVTIPDSVISIDNYAFYGCANLTIYGNKGSYAETYAKENDIPFIALNGTATDTISTPILSKAVNTSKGVAVTWSEVSDAESYNVYRKAGNAASWARVASVTGTAYTDSKVSSGTEYSYTVRAVKGDTLSGFDSTGISCLYLSRPEPKVASKKGYVSITWNKTGGAKGYYVYRKAPNAKSWTKIATVTGTAYADKNVKSGSNYVYTVRAFNGNVSSSFHSGVAIKYLARPTFKASNQNGYVSVTWNKVAGAAGYYVYRKAGNATSWTKAATVTSTAYNDKNIKSGTNYVYTVRAFNGNFNSSYHSGLTVKYLAQPTFKVSNGNGYVAVTWSKVAGAKSYYVYRKGPNDKSWVKIATATGTSYNDKNVKSGTNYTYTVRAYNGKACSSFHSGVAIKYLARPTFKVANKSKNVTVAWSKVAGAKGYYVYRKAGNATSWTKVATVTGTSYADKNVKKNVKYTYTVKAYNGKYTSTHHSGAGVKH